MSAVSGDCRASDDLSICVREQSEIQPELSNITHESSYSSSSVELAHHRYLQLTTTPVVGVKILQDFI